MVSGFRQFTRVIVRPAVGTSLLVLVGAISSVAPDVIPAGVSLAQSTELQHSPVIEGPTAVEFPENSTAAIAIYQVANATPDLTISWSIDGTDARRLSSR